MTRPGAGSGTALDQPHIVLRLIGASLGMGVTAFALVAWYVWRQGPAVHATPDPSLMFTVMWVLALAGIATATALWRSRVTPLLEAAGTDRVARAEALRTTVIMVWAVIEAPALFAVVVYYLYDIPLAGVLGVVLIWGALALTWPRRDWFDAGDRP